jgi:RNA recognition motif-containing protein
MLQATVVLDENTLRPLGFGYIEFNDEESLYKALEKDGAMLDGAVIQVTHYTGEEQVDVIDELIEPVEV